MEKSHIQRTAATEFQECHLGQKGEPQGERLTLQLLELYSQLKITFLPNQCLSAVIVTLWNPVPGEGAAFSVLSTWSLGRAQSILQGNHSHHERVREHASLALRWAKPWGAI